MPNCHQIGNARPIWLENATYLGLTTHLQRELELNGPEDGDDIPDPTMSTKQQHNRVTTSFPQVLTQGLPAITAKTMAYQRRM